MIFNDLSVVSPPAGSAIGCDTSGLVLEAHPLFLTCIAVASLVCLRLLHPQSHQISQLARETMPRSADPPTDPATTDDVTPPADDAPPSVCQPIETRAVCPICMIAMPLDPRQSIFETCCGKLICRGCAVGQRRAGVNETLLRRMVGGKSKAETERIEFQLMLHMENVPCAFCRRNRPSSEKEVIDNLRARIDKYNDAIAMYQLGDYYNEGLMGLAQNRSMAMKLYERSYDLGSPEAACRLYCYTDGAPDRPLKLKYLKEGVRRGHIRQSTELGAEGIRRGTVDDEEYSKPLLTRAARAGDDEAMGYCWSMFRMGILTKQELEATMRAKQATAEEVENDDREFAKRFHAYCTALTSPPPRC